MLENEVKEEFEDERLEKKKQVWSGTEMSDAQGWAQGGLRPTTFWRKQDPLKQQE